MKTQFSCLLSLATSAVLLLVACSEKPGRVPGDLQKQIALGEKIFAEKECGKCHMAKVKETELAKKAPDLTSVFLAMDTLFVKTHLQFTELTAMPPIELSRHEISALTQYVGSLHGKANMDPSLENPDGVCPICGAPVKFSEAEANHLKVTFQGKDYYFECPDCKIVFEKDPVWRSQSGYARIQ
jgi:YHS domain-containing protein/mono/diheme cytochrome c family protein